MITFTVAGIPVPQGSKSVNRHTGFMFEDNKRVMPWRQDVIGHAQRARAGQTPIQGPVEVELQFYFPHLKGHFGTGRNAAVLKASTPIVHSSKPDIDKVARAVLDALTLSGIWRDDSQVWSLTVTKRYSRQPGVQITIRTLQETWPPAAADDRTLGRDDAEPLPLDVGVGS